MVSLRITSFLLFVLLFAGCMDTPTAQDPVVEDDAEWNYSDDRVQIQSTNATNKDWVATLDEPPQLVVGEYWKVHMDFGLTGGSREAYMVVAGQEANHWLVGMPTHDFDNRIMVFHMPGLGQIDKQTLGFEAHDFWFAPVQFPLEEGDTWVTGLMAANSLQAEVVAVDGLTATIMMTGDRNITIVYDAEMRGIRSMDVAGYGSFEVLEHGFDWHEAEPDMDGLVTVPHMPDLILCHGRFAVAGEVTDCALGQVDQPSETVDIPSTYDRVSFGLIINSGLLVNPGEVPAQATYYEVTAIAPDGARYTESLSAVDGPSVVLSPYKHDAPGGTWTIDAIAGGPGMAFAEGIGYHVYDIQIPSGHILPSIGEHQHGSGEGH